MSGVFTFQSGYIQILLFIYQTEHIYTLHSNLVIFKFSTAVAQDLKALHFTFQSGYIQIGGGNNYRGRYVFFTFQSGYIQMGETFTEKFYICHLYIPIWFYSNTPLVSFIINSAPLYIPIWFYSNACTVNLPLCT